MAAPETLDELRRSLAHETRWARWLLGLSGSALTLFLLLGHWVDSVRNTSISQAPSFVPEWVGNFWMALGLLGGVTIALASVAMAHAIRQEGIKRRIARLETDASLAHRGSLSHPPIPPLPPDRMPFPPRT